MQRLRSPFRLRPGPGAEQRKGKARRERHGDYPSDTEGTAGAGRSSPPQTSTESALTSRGRQHGEPQELDQRNPDHPEGSGNE